MRTNNKTQNQNQSSQDHNTKKLTRQLEELRVAKQELTSGDTSGNVYVRFSMGSVMYPIERHVAEARVDRKLVHVLEEIDKQHV